jgi:hypothetical protein
MATLPIFYSVDSKIQYHTIQRVLTVVFWQCEQTKMLRYTYTAYLAMAYLTTLAIGDYIVSAIKTICNV